MRSVQYTCVTLVEVKPGKAGETIGLDETGLLPVYRVQPGFVAFTVVETGETTLISLSVWRSREQAEQAKRIGRRWVTEHAADLIASMNSHISEVGFFASAGEPSASAPETGPTPTPALAPVPTVGTARSRAQLH